MLLLFGLGWCPVLFAASTDEAVALFKAKDYPRARVELEKLVAQEPENSVACYYLGLALREGDRRRWGEAVHWLRRAVALQPGNAEYLADYGGSELMIADRERSLTAAMRGRDALESAVRLDPSDLDTHQLLFEFYLQAPWPLGSVKKASAHLDTMRTLKPGLVAALAVRLSTQCGEFDAAFRQCEILLAANSDDFSALYEFGWCAYSAGRELSRGVDCLKRALKLPIPSPASPQPAKLWWLIGELELKAGRREEARVAFGCALAMDPDEAAAAKRLDQLGGAPPGRRP